MRHLDGDEPLQLVVVGQVYYAEGPLAQHPLNAVTPDLLRDLLIGGSVISRGFPGIRGTCNGFGGILHGQSRFGA